MGGIHRRWLVGASLFLAACVPGVAHGGLVKATSPSLVKATSTSLIDTTVTVPGVISVDASVGLPSTQPDDTGIIGTIGDALCDLADGDLANTVCLLKAAEIRIVTEFGPARTTPLRREHVGIVGVPIPVNADNVTGADLTVTGTLAEGGRVQLRIQRLVAAPFPVSVEAFVSDPTPDSRRRFGGGYSGRESTAPGDFRVTVLPEARPQIDIAVTSPGPNLTVLGDLFTAAEDGTPVDPTRAAARLAPVPATTHVEFESTADASTGAETTDADLRVSSPTRLDLDLGITETSPQGVTTSSATQATATITDTLGATITTTPVADTVPAGESRLDVRLERGGPIGLAAVTQRAIDGPLSGPTLSTTQAELTGLPSVIAATVQPQTASTPLTVDVNPSGPIGTAQVALGDGRAPQLLPRSEPYVLRHDDGTSSATTVRVHGLEHAHVEVAAPNLLVDATLASAPLAVDVEQTGTDVEGLVADLPRDVDLVLRPDDGVVDYTGSATIADLDLILRQAGGLLTSERTGLAADELQLDLQGIPTEVFADLVPADGAPLNLSVGPEPLTRATVHLSDTLADGLLLPDDGTDAAIVRDLADRNALLVRLSSVRSAALLSDGDLLDVTLRTGEGTPDLGLDVRMRPAGGAGEDEIITGAIADRPACMRFALRETAVDPVCGTEPGAVLPPAAGQQSIVYEGRTGSIHAEALNLEALPDRKDLYVDLDAIPDRLDAFLAVPPTGLQHVVVDPVGGALGAAQVRLTDGPTDNALEPGAQGVLVRQIPGDRDVVLARLTQLERATAILDPQLIVSLNEGGETRDPIHVDVQSGAPGPAQKRALARMTDAPGCLRFSIGPATASPACRTSSPSIDVPGATNIALITSGRTGNVVIDEVRGFDGLPAGQTVHGTLVSLPPLTAATIQTEAGEVSRVRAQAPGVLGFAEVELEGGVERVERLAGQDGFTMRETADGSRTLARVTRLEAADVRPDPIDVRLDTDSTDPLRVDVRLVEGEEIDASLTGRPRCMRMALSEVSPDPVCGTVQAEPPPASGEQTHVRYEGSSQTTSIDLVARKLLAPDRNLHVDLDGVPQRLDAEVESGPPADDPDADPIVRRIDAAATGGTLDAVVARVTSGPTDDALPAGTQGVLVRELLGGRSVVLAELTQLDRATALLDPQIDVEINEGGTSREPIRVDVRREADAAPPEIVLADVTGPPSCLRFTVGQAEADARCGEPAPSVGLAGATNLTLQGAADTSRILVSEVSGIDGLPEGQAVHVDLGAVPPLMAARIETDGDTFKRAVAEAPENLGTVELELEGGMPDEDPLEGADGVTFRATSGGGQRLLVRTRSFERVDVGMDPVDIELRGAGARDLRVDIQQPDSGPDTNITGAMLGLPACLALGIRSEQGVVPGRCGRAAIADTFFDDGTNIGYQAAGVPAGGTDVTLDAAGLDALDDDATLHIGLDQLPVDLGAGLRFVAGNVRDGIDPDSRVRGFAAAPGLGQFDLTLDTGDPGAGALPTTDDGVHARFVGDASRIQTRVRGLRRADVDLDPLDIWISAAGGTPTSVLFQKDGQDITAHMAARPACLQFAVPEPLSGICSDVTTLGEEVTRQVNNVAALADGPIGDVDARVAGLDGFPDGAELKLDLDELPTSLVATIRQAFADVDCPDGPCASTERVLDSIELTGSAPGIGAARAQFEDGVDVDNRRVSVEGAFIDIPDAENLGAAVRVVGLQHAAVELSPLDILVEGPGTGAVDIDVTDATKNFAGDGTPLEVHANASARSTCTHFSVADEPRQDRCPALPISQATLDAVFREPVSDEVTANVIYEGPGATPDFDVTLDGLVEDNVLDIDLDDVPGAMLFGLNFFDGPREDVDSQLSNITSIERDSKYVHARSVGGVLGRATVHLKDGDTAEQIEAGSDGLFIDDRNQQSSPDRGLFIRASEVDHARVELFDTTGTKEFDFGTGPFQLPWHDISYHVDLDARAGRPLHVRYEHTVPDDPDEILDATLGEVPSGIEADVLYEQSVPDARTQVRYRADNTVEDLTVDASDLGGPFVDVDVDRIPSAIDLCMRKNRDVACGLDRNEDGDFDDANDIGPVSILDVDGSIDEEVGQTMRLRMNEEVTASAHVCQEDGERDDSDDDYCTRFDPGSEGVRIRQLSIEDIDVQMGTGKKERESEDNEDVQIVGLHTPGDSVFGARFLPSVVANRVVEIWDFDDPKVESMLFNLPYGLEATNRTFGIDGGAGNVPAWDSGTFTCPEDLTMFVAGKLFGFTIPDLDISKAACSNRE